MFCLSKKKNLYYRFMKIKKHNVGIDVDKDEWFRVSEFLCTAEGTEGNSVWETNLS